MSHPSNYWSIVLTMIEIIQVSYLINQTRRHRRTHAGLGLRGCLDVDVLSQCHYTYNMYPKTHIARARHHVYFDPDSLLHQFKKVMSLLQHLLLY